MSFSRIVIGALALFGLLLAAPPANTQAFYSWYKSLEYLDASGQVVGGFIVACPVTSSGSQPTSSWGDPTDNWVVLERGMCDPVYQVAQWYGFRSCSAQVQLDPIKHPQAYWIWTSNCPGFDGGGFYGP